MAGCALFLHLAEQRRTLSPFIALHHNRALYLCSYLNHLNLSLISHQLSKTFALVPICGSRSSPPVLPIFRPHLNLTAASILPIPTTHRCHYSLLRHHLFPIQIAATTFLPASNLPSLSTLAAPISFLSLPVTPNCRHCSLLN
ncbi:hypothetical protein AMTRI_Chr03g142030 [Amborella trichopoda]